MQIHIPPEIEEFAPHLQYFVDNMVRKLHVNRHKGFGDKPYVDLMDGLEAELNELRHALERESQFDAMLESVDVANFAFLMALRAMGQSKDQFEEERNP